jgi:hypothetical protein
MSLLEDLGNDQLLVALKELVERDCGLEAELISHLGEVEARRLHLEPGCSSMFDYCVNVLCFAEGVAYKRIGVARAVRNFPEAGRAISRGEIHLSGASLITPHLSQESVGEWLKAARHRTTREIKQLIADRFPREAVRSSVRRVPSRSGNADRVLRTIHGQRALLPVGPPTPNPPRPGTTEARRPGFETPSILPANSAPSIRSGSSESSVSSARAESPKSGMTEALGAERYVVRLTADEKVHAQLQELRSLLRHSVPDGDVGKILARAIGVLLEQVRKQKIGATDSPRAKDSSPSPPKARSLGASPKGSKFEAEPCSPQGRTPAKRKIPVAIRRTVWKRDSGRCTYQSSNGRGCESREALEFHHRVPWAHCREHTVDNIALRCRAHNQYEAVLDFGSEHMRQFRVKARRRHFKEAIDLEEIGC